MTQMTLKHRVRINVCDEHGRKQPVLRSGTARLPKRLLKWLFGDFCEVLVLTPGKTVGEVEIHEVPGGERRCTCMRSTRRLLC